MGVLLASPYTTYMQMVVPLYRCELTE